MPMNARIEREILRTRPPRLLAYTGIQWTFAALDQMAQAILGEKQCAAISENFTTC